MKHDSDDKITPTCGCFSHCHCDASKVPHRHSSAQAAECERSLLLAAQLLSDIRAARAEIDPTGCAHCLPQIKVNLKEIR